MEPSNTDESADFLQNELEPKSNGAEGETIDQPSSSTVRHSNEKCVFTKLCP